MKAAASHFTTEAKPDDIIFYGATTSQETARFSEIVSNFKTTFVLFEDKGQQAALVTSALSVSDPGLDEILQNRVSQAIGIDPDNVFCCASHAHTIPASIYQGRLTRVGDCLAASLEKAAVQAKDSLQNVTIDCGRAQEHEITYNRRGYRPGGYSYFRRSIDIRDYPDDPTPPIDPDATVVLAKDNENNPLFAIASFTGHPITSYNPENIVAFGEYPQVASSMLSSKLGGVPVAFLQGCAGDVNSLRGVQTSVSDAIMQGRKLGDTFIQALDSLTECKGNSFSVDRVNSAIPFRPLPDRDALIADLNEMDAYDGKGLNCLRLNLASTLSDDYRKSLVERMRPWYDWALDTHNSGKAQTLPSSQPIKINLMRYGSMALLGMPYEPFAASGRLFKALAKQADMPWALPVGYCNGYVGYVPSGNVVTDEAYPYNQDYMCAGYRYLPGKLPWGYPAGDAVVKDAVDALSGM